MVKKAFAKTVDSTRHTNFITVAESFYEAARMAYELEYYNASGVLYIHSAIAYADAITIKLSGKKCSGENHYAVINLLDEVLPQSTIDKKAFTNFKQLIDHKNLVSYTGDIYHKKDLDKISKHFERFKIWSETVLNITRD